MKELEMRISAIEKRMDDYNITNKNYYDKSIERWNDMYNHFQCEIDRLNSIIVDLLKE